MRRLSTVLLLVLPLLAACGDETPPPGTQADLARLAFDALRSGDVELLKPAIPTEADFTWALATMTKEAPVEEGKRMRKAFEELGGAKGVAEQAAERVRASLDKARQGGSEIWDWADTTFGGLVEEKSQTSFEKGIETGDVFFLVRAGEREELFALGKCARMPDRWITMEGLRFRASPHSSLDEAKIRLTKHRLRMLDDMVRLFEMKNGRKPESLSDLGNPGGAEGEGVEGTKVTDAWGRPFEMRLEGEAVRLRSPGPDGELDTEDDVVWPEE